MDRIKLNEKDCNINNSARKKKKVVTPEKIIRTRQEKCCTYCLCYCKERIKQNPRYFFNIVGHIKVSNNVDEVLYHN